MSKNHPLFLSDSFTKKLEKIKNKSLVADLILNGDTDLFVLDGIHHISYKDAESLFTYCPKGKSQQMTDDGKWVKDGRQSAKIGKLPRMIFDTVVFNRGMINDKDIETFVNHIKGAFVEDDKLYDFKEVSGDDIHRYYQAKCYYSDGTDQCRNSSLHGSCMRNGDEQLLELYCNYPEQISMVILVDKNDKIHGRAILWTLDNGFMYMDRPYVVGDKYFAMFHSYASDNGYYYYNSNKTTKNMALHPDSGKAVSIELSVTFKKDTRITQFPYMDTMRFVAIKNRRVENKTVIGVYGGLNNESINAYCRETNGSNSELNVQRAADTGRLGMTQEFEGGEVIVCKVGYEKSAWLNKYVEQQNIRTARTIIERADGSHYRKTDYWANVICYKDECFEDDFTSNWYCNEHKRTSPDGRLYGSQDEITTSCGYTTSKRDVCVCDALVSKSGIERQWERREKCYHDGYNWILREEVAYLRKKKEAAAKGESVPPFKKNNDGQPELSDMLSPDEKKDRCFIIADEDGEEWDIDQRTGERTRRLPF